MTHKDFLKNKIAITTPSPNDDPLHRISRNHEH